MSEHPAVTRHVFAFEGHGGFPGWASPGADTAPRLPTEDAGAPILGRGLLSLSQVLNFWYDAVQAAGNCRWRYYAQNHWRRAAREILRLATRPDCKAGAGREPVVLLGYSNGGDAAYQIARALGRRGVEIELVITADPVRKPWRGAGLLGFRKPACVDVWHNFFQRFDRRSLAGRIPVLGRAVAGAESNRRIEPQDFPHPEQRPKAHIWLPSLPVVRATITREIAAVGN